MPEKADVLIFAPHPDDAVLACAGIILQNLAAGRQVHVVTLTYGDSFTLAAATAFSKPAATLTAADMLELGRLRQAEEMAALTYLGVAPHRITFLGYADGGLNRIYHTDDDQVYTHPQTLKNHTYGWVQSDYHSLAHAGPAPYCKASVVADLSEIIQRVLPECIYVTHPADTHADHRAAFRFVRDAIKACGFTGPLYGAMIHAGSANAWPIPAGATPDSPFAPVPLRAKDGSPLLEWPPPHRIELSQAHAAVKLKAIHIYRSQVQLTLFTQYLESFVKNEEIFWPITARSSALPGGTD